VTPAQLIARKRDGEELSGSSIADFIEQYALGRIPDYQMSALAMAIYFQGMSRAETVSLTRAMLGVLCRDDCVDTEPTCKRLGIELTSLDELLRKCIGPESTLA